MTHTLALIQRYRDSQANCHGRAAQEHAAQAAYWCKLWREQGGTLRAVDEDIDTRPSEMD